MQGVRAESRGASILCTFHLTHNFIENTDRLFAGEGVIVAHDGKDEALAAGGGQISGKSVDMKQ